MPGIFGSSVPKLHKAARKGDKAKVERLLQKWNTVYRDSKQRTALHYASAYGHPEVVRLLIQKKFDLNAWDSDHDTALIKAVKCYEEDCVSILLEHGANPNIANTKGDTALHYAVYSSKSSLTAKLLSHGADAEAKNKEGLTPLMLALRENRMKAAALLKKTETKNVVNEPERKNSQCEEKESSNSDNSPPVVASESETSLTRVVAIKIEAPFMPVVAKKREIPFVSDITLPGTPSMPEPQPFPVAPFMPVVATQPETPLKSGIGRPDTPLMQAPAISEDESVTSSSSKPSPVNSWPTSDDTDFLLDNKKQKGQKL